jgi:hypothetical protein
MKNKIEEIFKEIDQAIERTKSPFPVTISESKLLIEINKIKQKWINTNEKENNN